MIRRCPVGGQEHRQGKLQRLYDGDKQIIYQSAPLFKRGTKCYTRYGISTQEHTGCLTSWSRHHHSQRQEKRQAGRLNPRLWIAGGMNEALDITATGAGYCYCSQEATRRNPAGKNYLLNAGRYKRSTSVSQTGESNKGRAGKVYKSADQRGGFSRHRRRIESEKDKRFYMLDYITHKFIMQENKGRRLSFLFSFLQR